MIKLQWKENQITNLIKVFKLCNRVRTNKKTVNWLNSKIVFLKFIVINVSIQI